MNAKQKVIDARVKLVINEPFFGNIALRFNLEEDASQPTAYVDGKKIGYNPSFIDGLSDAEVVGLIAHEVLHVALGHVWRASNRDLGKWNIACDHAINPLLLQYNFSLPSNGCASDNIYNNPYPGQSAEAIYDQLPEQEQDSATQRSYQGPGGVRPYPDDVAQARVAQEQMETIVRQAAQSAKIQGRLFGSLEEKVNEAIRPKVNWRELLHQFSQANIGRDDYDWSLPNYNYSHLGIYMPRLRDERVKHVVVAVDTSGSISKRKITQFLAEIRAIHEEARPDLLSILWADAKVHHVDHYDSEDFIEWRFVTGRGGTNFRPATFWVRKAKPEVSVFVYLTDGYGKFSNKPLSIPTLWLIDSDVVAPWGETVRMEEKL